jgi:hypothetical protein
MKTTLELPDDLVNEIKIRAMQDGRDVSDTIAELLRKGLTLAESAARAPLPKNLPVAPVRKLAGAATAPTDPQEMSDWVKEALLALDIEQHEKSA